VGLLSRPILSRLFQMKVVTHKASNVKQFEELLGAEFESKWEALRKCHSESQTSLFNTATTDGLRLD
jgi:hypothetical protein